MTQKSVQEALHYVWMMILQEFDVGMKIGGLDFRFRLKGKAGNRMEEGENRDLLYNSRKEDRK